MQASDNGKEKPLSNRGLFYSSQLFGSKDLHPYHHHGI
ncbi:hypothetical protein C943_00940 [Mariniradius saccharolyticus AK6]|uniref:Uncharacterized protein n=1 Tax=Mariniradius saccharolyticus AK6 TaxID=1239962 RepID=M7XEH5_9BACT|nr:hypothetical protein C943_00940 [Mariniradius saccharolyticus AK6]